MKRSFVSSIASVTPPARLDEEEEKEEKDSSEKQQVSPSYAVDKHLFEARTVLITGEVSMRMAQSVCARLLALAYVNSDPIHVVISSPGGHVESGDMIHDIIRFIRPEVRILGVGWVASAGALIYVSVPKERRFCTPNTRFLIHQPLGGAEGPATNIEIQARQMLLMRDRLNKIFAEATGQDIARIEKDTDRDYWMNPQEAIDYGLVGRVVETLEEFEQKLRP